VLAVAVDRTATVNTKPEKSVDMALYQTASDAKSFDAMYLLIRADIINGNITPSARSLANKVVEFAQNDKKIKRITVSIPECRQLANEIRKRLLNEKVIKENPDYKNGCAKYVVA